MVKVAVVGATGYTALELIRILLNHPHAEIAALTTRQESSPRIDSIHPSLSGKLNLPCEILSAADVAKRARFVFAALPHVAAMGVVPDLLAAGCRVVDLSADYRFRDPAHYEKWYGHPHTDPERTRRTVYGLPELFAEKIPSADLVANPGCYTSTSILALAPFLCRRLIDPADIIIDAKSGVSGGGRTPKLNLLFSECNESIAAYSVGNHRHQPEIEQVLGEASGQSVQVTFTPHLVPMDRGILCTIYARPISSLSEADALATLCEFYRGKPFVQVVEHLPATKDVIHTNSCHVTARVTQGRLVILAALDNLVKGAAGVAVQNFNLMNGFPETLGLSR